MAQFGILICSWELQRLSFISGFLTHKQSHISLLLSTSNVCVSNVAWLICCGTTVFFRHGSIPFFAVHHNTPSWQTVVLRSPFGSSFWHAAIQEYTSYLSPRAITAFSHYTKNALRLGIQARLTLGQNWQTSTTLTPTPQQSASGCGWLIQPLCRTVRPKPRPSGNRPGTGLLLLASPKLQALVKTCTQGRWLQIYMPDRILNAHSNSWWCHCRALRE